MSQCVSIASLARSSANVGRSSLLLSVLPERNHHFARPTIGLFLNHRWRAGLCVSCAGGPEEAIVGSATTVAKSNQLSAPPRSARAGAARSARPAPCRSRSSISSISALVMISGGLKHSASLTTVRPITPCSSHQLDQPRADLGAGIEVLVRRLVGHQLDRGDQADAAHLAHQLVAGEAAAQLGLHVRADLADMRADVDLVVDLQRLDRHRRRHRMAGVGEAVAERADLVALVGQRPGTPGRSPSPR